VLGDSYDELSLLAPSTQHLAPNFHSERVGHAKNKIKNKNAAGGIFN